MGEKSDPEKTLVFSETISLIRLLSENLWVYKSSLFATNFQETLVSQPAFRQWIQIPPESNSFSMIWDEFQFLLLQVSWFQKNCQAANSSKKRINKFVFSTVRQRKTRIHSFVFMKKRRHERNITTLSDLYVRHTCANMFSSTWFLI